MEKCNKPKLLIAWDKLLNFFGIYAIIAILLLIIDVFLIIYTEYKGYKNIAYIKLPGKESCMKEYKYYDIYSHGNMITLILTDGTKITTSTKNVVLVKGRKGINNGNEYILK